MEHPKNKIDESGYSQIADCTPLQLYLVDKMHASKNLEDTAALCDIDLGGYLPHDIHASLTTEEGDLYGSASFSLDNISAPNNGCELSDILTCRLAHALTDMSDFQKHIRHRTKGDFYGFIIEIDGFSPIHTYYQENPADRRAAVAISMELASSTDTRYESLRLASLVWIHAISCISRLAEKEVSNTHDVTQHVYIGQAAETAFSELEFEVVRQHDILESLGAAVVPVIEEDLKLPLLLKAEEYVAKVAASDKDRGGSIDFSAIAADAIQAARRRPATSGRPATITSKDLIRAAYLHSEKRRA